jgi:hypothetical protein
MDLLLRSQINYGLDFVFSRYILFIMNLSHIHV